MGMIALWFAFAGAMIAASVLVHADPQTLGLCFLAWCGGIVSTLAYQAIRKMRSNV